MQTWSYNTKQCMDRVYFIHACSDLVIRATNLYHLHPTRRRWRRSQSINLALGDRIPKFIKASNLYKEPTKMGTLLTQRLSLFDLSLSFTHRWFDEGEVGHDTLGLMEQSCMVIFPLVSLYTSWGWPHRLPHVNPRPPLWTSLTWGLIRFRDEPNILKLKIKFPQA